MGHAIEALAAERGHEVTVKIDKGEPWPSKMEADVAIEFTTPTTGWYADYEKVVAECKARSGRLFTATNFSIGMNIMFALNERLAAMMRGRNDYKVSISETHHIHKLDAPSGTAITLAEDIIEELDRKDEWQLKNADGKGRHIKKHAIPITSIREGEVPGIHEVVYDSDIDTITLRHSAKSRKGLALGAVLACEFMEGRKGYHTMRDLLA